MLDSTTPFNITTDPATNAPTNVVAKAGPGVTPLVTSFLSDYVAQV
jgi:hypothetical protein